MNEEWGEGFVGAPYEALGNVNDALYAGGAGELVYRVAGLIGEAKIHPERTLREGDSATMLLLYPGTGPVNIGMLVSNVSGRATLISLYPVLEGLLNKFKVENFKAWENGREGMVAVDTGEIGLLGFFDPFYYCDHWNLKLGATREFSLAGLAFNLEIAKNEEFEVREGPLYDMALAEFLKEQPGKTEKDFPIPKVIMGSAQMLWPTDYTGEYHYRALVLAAEEIDFLDAKLWRFHLSFIIEEDKISPEIWLYAAPHIIKGKTPKVGDYIEGFCWLAGYLPIP